MGTEILRPQDCLTGRTRASPELFPRRRRCNYGNSASKNRININRSPNPRPSRKQQQPPVRFEKLEHKWRSGQPEPSTSRKWSSDDSRAGRVGLVMEKVTVLRRGASLDSKFGSELPLKMERSDPSAKQVQSPELQSPMMTKCDVYAGSAFAVSPEPSVLPLPSFSKKKVVALDDLGLATRDLRRLLLLD